MPLDGLRAWIGEVERKLGMRTRVFLVLATIAIGGAGAAIYLAVDTREDAVSESDVRELQQRLEAQIAEDAATAPETESVEPSAPQPEPVPKPGPQSGSGSGEGTGNLGDLLEEAEKQNKKAEAAE
jgi:hypothetical protein